MANSFIRAIEVVRGGYLKPGPTDTQFDATQLASHLFKAERKYVVKVIGKEFYENLKPLRNANNINYNPQLGAVEIAFPSDPNLEELFRNQELFTLIAYAVVVEALPWIWLKIASTGVQMINGSYATPASKEQMRYLRDELKEDIQELQEHVQEYLCENQELFTPYGFNPEEFCESCKKLNDKSKPSSLPVWYT